MKTILLVVSAQLGSNAQAQCLIDSVDVPCEFGSPIEVSLAGNFMAALCNTNGTFVYQKVGAGWELFDQLPGGDSMSLTGDLLVIGDQNAEEVLAYRWSGASWDLEGQLTANLPGDHNLGRHVHGAGETIVAAAPGLQPNGGVAVFERGESGWAHTDLLLPTPGSEGGLLTEVRTDGERIVAGRAGSGVHVYAWDAGGWTQEAFLVPSGSSREIGDLVGFGGEAIVSASFQGEGFVVFEKLSIGWAEVAQFAEPTIVLDVDAAGESFVVGTGGTGVGAQVFRRRHGDWLHYAEIEVPGSDEVPVAVGGEFYVVGLSLFGLNVGVYSLRDYGEQLVGCPQEVSMSAGGAQVLSIDAGESTAGDYYLVTGSLNGTSPGAQFGGVHVGLNLDEYFVFTLVKANNPPPLLNTLAPLSSTGEGTATLMFPGGVFTGLAGLTMHHAFLRLSPNTLQLLSASNSVQLDLLN